MAETYVAPLGSEVSAAEGYCSSGREGDARANPTSTLSVPSMRRSRSQIPIRLPVEQTRPISSMSFASAVAGIAHRSMLTAVEREDATLDEEMIWTRHPSLVPAREMWQRQSSAPGDQNPGHELLTTRMSKAVSAEALQQALAATEKVGPMMKIDRRDLMRAVFKDERDFQMCVALPLMMFYALLVVVFFQEHCATSSIYLLESTITDGLLPPDMQVSTPTDIVHWMRGSLAPFVWRDLPAASAADPSAEPSERRQYTEIIAGVRFETIRTPIVECTIGGTTNCYRQTINNTDLEGSGWRPTEELFANHRRLSAGGLFRRGFPPPAAWSRHLPRRRLDRKDVLVRSQRSGALRRARAGLPGTARRLAAGGGRPRRGGDEASRRLSPFSLVFGRIDASDGFVLDIPTSMALEDFEQLIDGFGDASQPLILRSTESLCCSFVVRHEGRHQGLITTVYLRFITPHSGGIYVQLDMHSLVSTSPARVTLWLTMWIVLLLYITVTKGLSFFVALRAKSATTFLMDARHIIDGLLVIAGWATVVVVVLEILRVNELVDVLVEYGETRFGMEGQELQELDRSMIEPLFSKAQWAFDASTDVVNMAFLHHVMLILPFLLATSGHTRLAITLQTLRVCLSDLLHLACVCIILAFGYAMSGHVLLGHLLPEMSTIMGSIGYCLQVIYQRQYYEEAVTEDYYATTIWFLSMLVVFGVLLMNILIIILFEACREVRATMEAYDTLLSVLKMKARKLGLEFALVPNTGLLMLFAQFKSKDRMTFAQMLRMCPDVHPKQLQMIFRSACILSVMSRKSRQRGEEHIGKYLASLLLGLSTIRRCVRAMATNDVCRNVLSQQSEEPCASINVIAATAASMPDTSSECNRGSKRTPVKSGWELEKEEWTTGTPQSDLGEVPEEAPVWVQSGLLLQLRQQQEAMGELLQQLEAARDEMRRRGLQPLGEGCDLDERDGLVPPPAAGTDAGDADRWLLPPGMCGPGSGCNWRGLPRRPYQTQALSRRPSASDLLASPESPVQTPRSHEVVFEI